MGDIKDAELDRLYGVPQDADWDEPSPPPAPTNRDVKTGLAGLFDGLVRARIPKPPPSVVRAIEAERNGLADARRRYEDDRREAELELIHAATRLVNSLYGIAPHVAKIIEEYTIAAEIENAREIDNADS